MGDACYFGGRSGAEWLLLFFLLDLVGPKALDLNVVRAPTAFLVCKGKGKKA